MFKFRIIGPDGERIVLLGDDDISIGRDPHSTIVLNDGGVSRQHASVRKEGDEYWIIDLGSANGTLLRGRDIRKQGEIPLRDGDELEIDGFTLIFEAPVREPDLEAPPTSESQKRCGKKTPDPPSPKEPSAPPYWGDVPPGLSRYSVRLLDYLPDIYHPVALDINRLDPSSSGDRYADGPHNFLSRFLALFESVLLPLEWTVDGFDMFLNPATAPVEFLPWIASWFALTFDPSWDEPKRRKALAQAPWLFARRGTKSALNCILEIYTGESPKIIDDAKDLKAHTFVVNLSTATEEAVDRELLEAIINTFKPAHTLYSLHFVESPRPTDET